MQLDLTKIKAVIFDLDGTLVDSRLDFAAMRRDIGIPGELPILEFIEEMQSELDRENAYEILRRHETQGAEDSTVIEGVNEYLSVLKRDGFHLGIFTRNIRGPTMHVVDKFFPNIFTNVITRECAPPKPSPAGLLSMCKEWGVEPSEAIYVGDYLFDLQAGNAAGMTTFLYHTEAELPDYADQAGFVFTSFSQLTEMFDVSAPATRLARVSSC